MTNNAVTAVAECNEAWESSNPERADDTWDEWELQNFGFIAYTRWLAILEYIEQLGNNVEGYKQAAEQLRAKVQELQTEVDRRNALYEIDDKVRLETMLYDTCLERDDLNVKIKYLQAANDGLRRQLANYKEAHS